MALTEGQTGLMVDAEGNVYTVGYNGQGQLGNGTTENTNTFQQVKLKKSLKFQTFVTYLF